MLQFTIAIPVHNGAKYLKETLKSALDQRRRADEIVVVDDASTDNSLDIVRASLSGDRVRILTNKQPTGFVDAWNRVVRIAQSDFVTILHQDDVLDPGYLSAAEEALTTFPECQHFYVGYDLIDEQGKHIGHSPLPYLGRCRNFCVVASMRIAISAAS